MTRRQQYFSDEIIGKAPKGNGRKKTYDPSGAGDLLIGHGRGLFDQNEDMGGNLMDEYTGEEYDNSTFDVLEEPHDPDDHRFSEVNPLDHRIDEGYQDVLQPVKEKKDSAAKWLAKHDLGAVEVIQVSDDIASAA